MSCDEEPVEEYEIVEEEMLVGKVNDVLIRDKKSIAQTRNGLRKRRIGQRFLAACGHLIHSIEEIGGRCQHKGCNALVCRDCLRICERCFKAICPKHSKLHQGEVYCPTCKIVRMLFGGSPRRANVSQQAPFRERHPTLYRWLVYNPDHPWAIERDEDGR